MDVVEARATLENLKKEFGFREPDRGNLDDPDIKWREGKPDYTMANLAFLKGKTQNHSQGSLEEVVENLVKTWEMEASHKIDLNQWVTVDPTNYQVQVNGVDKMPGSEAKEIGNYNALMRHCPMYHKYGTTTDFEKSHELFRSAFTDGFPWEVMKVYTMPPSVMFSWRHWGDFKGHFNEVKGQGQVVSMLGLCRATLNDNMKVTKLELFFDVEGFLKTMEGEIENETLVPDLAKPYVEVAAASKDNNAK